MSSSVTDTPATGGQTTTLEQPSQAEKLQAVADAGPGATDGAVAGDPLSEKPANGTTMEPTKEVNGTALKPGQTAVPKERSAVQVGLIMFSLCVWLAFLRESRCIASII